MARTEKSSRFKYKKRDASSVKERQNQRSGNFDSIFKDNFKTYKVKDGKNLIRILPPTWDDARHYGLDIHVNYSIGVDNQTYLSLSKMKNEKDPIEEGRRAAEREGDEKLASALKPKKRVLMWVIDRMEEDEGPQLWASPWTVDRDVANLCFDEDTNEAIQIDDPEEGADLRFYREGKGRNTEYNPAKMKILKPSPLSDDEGLQQEWLDFVADNPLPTVLNYYDYDHIAAVFSGGKAKEDDDDDDDDKPRSKLKRGKASDDDDDDKPVRRKSRAATDDDDDDDDKPVTKRRKVADDDDEDDDKPVRRKRATADDDDDDDAPKPKGRKASTDDEDEDEDKPVKRKRTRLDDDDDDEDEKPKRRKVADDDDEDDDKPVRRKAKADDEDEDEDEDDKPKRPSVRDRLKGRSKRQADED